MGLITKQVVTDPHISDAVFEYEGGTLANDSQCPSLFLSMNIVNPASTRVDTLVLNGMSTFSAKLDGTI